MKNQIGKILTTLILACGLLAACDSAMYTVAVRPSDPIYERPVSPGDGYIWIDGDWVWEGGRYNWHNGYWSRPRGTRVWVSGGWESRGGGYAWRRGHWK